MHTIASISETSSLLWATAFIAVSDVTQLRCRWLGKLLAAVVGDGDVDGLSTFVVALLTMKTTLNSVNVIIEQLIRIQNSLAVHVGRLSPQSMPFSSFVCLSPNY